MSYELIISDKKNSSILYFIIAFCFPVFLYLQTINFGFTHFDDDELIEKNITFLNDLGNAHQAFLTDAFIGKSLSFYRPLQTFSYMIDMQLCSGKSITCMFHLSNILIFGIIACLLFLLLLQFLIPPMFALLSTLLFCANPLFVSFIAWIPARGDLLLTLFSLLSFLFFIKLLQNGKIIYLVLNWASFTIALFCKETAALLPFLFVLYYYAFSSEKHFNKNYLFNILLYFIFGMFWFLLRYKAIGGVLNSNEKDVVGLIPLLSNLRTIPESLAKFFLPCDNNPIPIFSIFKTLAGLSLILIIIILFFKNREKSKKEKIFCLSLFLIFMFPPMLYKDKYADYFDHCFFLPMSGILLFVLFLFPKKWLEIEVNKKSLSIIIVLIFLSSFTLIKTRIYSNPMIFYNSAIYYNPNSSEAYNNRGREKYLIHDFKGAISDCSRAITICTTNKEAYNNRGNAKAIIGDNYGAMQDYDKAIAINSFFAQAYYNKGVLEEGMGDNFKAIECYNKAIDINPRYDQAYYNVGALNEKMGNNPAAIEYYNRAIAVNSKYDQAYYNIGTIKAKMGDITGAIKYYKLAIDINPLYDQAYNNIGTLKANMGDNIGALEYYKKALAINPKYDQAYYNIGVSKANMGDNLSAINYFNKAIAINPKYFQAYCNIGVSKISMGDYHGAIEACYKAIEINPNIEQAYFNIGLSKENTGDNPGAIECYKKAIAINPESVQSYYNLGVLKINMGDIFGAIEAFNKAIAFRPNYADAYNNIGAILYSIGNYNEAINNFNKAIEINPKYLNGYENRALAKYHLKDLTGAIEDCEKAININPNDEKAQHLKAKIQKELK